MKHGKKEENGIFSNHIVHGTEKLIIIIKSVSAAVTMAISETAKPLF